MQKIKTLFVIDRENGSVAINEKMPNSEWVFNGEGRATVKHDGSACLVREGRLFKRFDAKAGRKLPEGAEPCGEPDEVTKHHPHWVPVLDLPENKWHLEAFAKGEFEDGTYEIVGPKVNGNKQKLDTHELWKHGSVTVDVPRNFDSIKEWLETHAEFEGLVFHHDDGSMFKIRRKDFKFKW